MDDILEFIKEGNGIVDHILEILPSDRGMAMAILSMCIDKYAAHFDMKSSEYWDMVYEVAKEIHNTFGDYMEDK